MPSGVSVIRYLRPLLPPGASFHSSASSKLLYSPVVMMSPPDSGFSPLPTFLMVPSTTAQPSAGKVVGWIAAPSLGGLAVEQQLPTRGLLGCGQGIRRGSAGLCLREGMRSGHDADRQGCCRRKKRRENTAPGEESRVSKRMEAPVAGGRIKSNKCPTL